MILIQTIADIDAYVFLLRTNKAIATCDQSVKNFVVQDFDIKDKKLKVSIVIPLLQLMFITISYIHRYIYAIPLQSRTFYFVSRCGKFFAGESHWVYWCTCNKKKSELIDSFSWSSHMSFAEVSDILLNCMHVKAVQNIVVSLDGIQSISADSDLSGIANSHNYCYRKYYFLIDHSYSASGYAMPMPIEDFSSPVAALQVSVYCGIRLRHST